MSGTGKAKYIFMSRYPNGVGTWADVADVTNLTDFGPVAKIDPEVTNVTQLNGALV